MRRAPPDPRIHPGTRPGIHRSPDARAVIGRLIDALDVPDGFPDAALAGAAAALADPGIDDPALADWTDVAFVTVDDDGSRDLDQALHVEALEGASGGARGGAPGGGWRVRYALADTTRHVVPGTALWDAALERGATLYAPDRALPMLPRSLSEDLVSLDPGVARRALVFDMRVAADGAILRTDVLRARVRSRSQLTYAGVQRVVDGEAPPAAARAANPESLAVGIDAAASRDVLASLRALAAVGVALAARGRAAGVMAFDRIESDVRVTGDPGAGEPSAFDVTPRARLASESWNEQLSLACNREGAALLVALETDDPSLEPVYRVHDAPDPRRLRRLDETLVALADALELDGPWRRDPKRGPPLAEWFDALPRRPARRRRAIQRQILRAQRASRYTGEPGRHHALATDGYARFSSPMREIVGVHTHRVLLRALGLVAPVAAEATPEARTALRDAVVASAEAARARQKGLDRAVLFEVIAALFEADLAGDGSDGGGDGGGDGEGDGGPPWRDGTVLGVEPNKLHVGLDGLALDVKLWREDLEATTGVAWTFDAVSARPGRRADRAEGAAAETGTAIGAAPPVPAPAPIFLGDGVQVRARRFDPKRGRYALEVRLLDVEPG